MQLSLFANFDREIEGFMPKDTFSKNLLLGVLFEKGVEPKND